MSRKNEHVRPGDILQVIHAFAARSPDELSFSRGDRVELIEKDDDFGDGWYLGKNIQNGKEGLFPEVYTQPAPKPTLTASLTGRSPRIPITEPPSSLPHKQTGNEQLPDPDQQPTGSQLHDSAPPSSSSTQDPVSPSQPAPLQTSSNMNGQQTRQPVAPTAPRSISMTLNGDAGSPVMNETLSVIDEHITDMNTPRHSVTGHDRRAANDSGSEYSSHLDSRLSYIQGEETDEEEAILTRAEVLSWSPQRVAEYLEDAGVDKRHCDVFRDQEINGEVLLGMDQPTIFLKEFELGPVGPRLRIWMKVKKLQEEVQNQSVSSRHQNISSQHLPVPDDSTSDLSRHRSTSVGSGLPRIPSLSQGAGSRTPTRQAVNRLSTASNLQPSRYSPASGMRESTPPLAPTPAAPGHAHRPSAHSVRSLHHNRRHSAIDTVATPLLDDPEALGPGVPRGVTHRKEPSFDRGWTMGGAPKSADSIRPTSSVFHAHSHSAASAQYTAVTPTERELNVSQSADLDRGYFSGGELDNRKSLRNVLRKKDSPSHSRQQSYQSETAKRLAPVTAAQKRQSRFGSADSLREPSSSMSAAAWAYYGHSHRKSSGKRNNTVPLLSPSKPFATTSKDSPTVTKLDYGDTPSIDTVTNSPKNSSSLGRASPSPNTSGSFFKKKRITGLRAISDAITGHEKSSYAPSTDSTLVSSPTKDSPLHSPTRTGSTTPTTTTKSFDMEDGEKSKRATAPSGPSILAFPPRRRDKKHTSAYTRGLLPLSPKEQMESCDYSGWMKKKSSNLMTTWKPRLFVLRGRRLSYYYSEFDTEEKGLIDISSHRVLPANEEKLTGIHAAVTRAMASPSSPNNATITTTAAADAAKEAKIMDDTSGAFIFKLVPPRNGLTKGVNFTKPTVHYFAVDNIVQGRLWMAALMKATIDKDPDAQVLSTYKDKTISLAKAMRRKERPPALMGSDEEDPAKLDTPAVDGQGLAITGLGGEKADSGVGEDKFSSIEGKDATVGDEKQGLAGTADVAAPSLPPKDLEHAEQAKATIAEANA